MTQKNIIIILLVGIIILLSLFGLSRWQYGSWGMMGWMHEDMEEYHEEMEEHMHDDSDGHEHDEFDMHEEMEEHMDLDESETVTSADNAPPGSMHNLPVPEAVAAVKTHVATELGISEGTVIVMSAYEQEWSDGCLGLGGPAESCIAVLTPGYEVTVLAQGSERVFRTNADGSVIREES